MRARSAGLVVASALLFACGAEPASAPPAEAAREMSAGARFVEARRPTAAALLEAPARVVAEDAAAAEIGVLDPGRLIALHVAAGDRIEPGAPVADVVLPAVADAAARVGPVTAQLAATRRRIGELEKLRAEGLVRAEAIFELSAQAAELTAARRQAAATLSRYGLDPRAARALREAGHVTLEASLGGVVVERARRLGAVVGPSSPPIAVIAGPRPARIEASLVDALPAEAELAFVGQDGRVVPLDPRPIADFRDGETGRLTVWLRPRESAPLPDGLSGRVRVRLPEGAVEVPSAAVGRRGAQAFVRVLRGEHPEEVEVEVILDSGTAALVRGPLEPGDRVASRPGEGAR